MTKFQKSSLAWFVIYVVVLGAVIFSASSCTNRSHKYTIGYAHGKWSFEDYTDTFQVSNGSVKYIDESGAETTRYGTFSIQKNKDFQK
jgi:hypothetical protein